MLGFPVAQLIKNQPAIQETSVDSWVRKILWRRNRLPTPVLLGFPGGSDGKVSACNARDLSSIPRLGRSPGGGHGNPLQYSCLENLQGQRHLAGCSPWSLKESDTAEQLSIAQHKPPKIKSPKISRLFYFRSLETLPPRFPNPPASS